MTRTTAHVSISLDGFVAGPDQDKDNPLGVGGLQLHTWHIGEAANEADATLAVEILRPRGAFIMGRNMFGPIRGEWDEDWSGWWGDKTGNAYVFNTCAIPTRTIHRAAEVRAS